MKNSAFAETFSGNYHQVVDVSTLSSDLVVVDGKGILVGVYINADLSAALELADDEDTMFIIPEGAMAGTMLFLGDIGFETSLTIPSVSGTGSVTVIYLPH